MKTKQLAKKKASKLTMNGNLKMIYPKPVREAMGLRGGDYLEHAVYAVGKRKFIISELVSDGPSQEHEELFELLKD